VTGRMTASAVLDDGVALSMNAGVTVRRTDPAGLAGQTLASADLRSKTGCTVVAVERNGDVVTRLGPDFRIQAGDELVIAGTDQAVRQFEQML